MTYPAEVLADSPAGYWRFEEGNPPFQDETAGNHDGTVKGVCQGWLSVREPGIANSRGLRWKTNSDEAGPYVEMSAGVLSSPTSWTYELWFRPTIILASTGTDVLLGIGGGETSRIGWFSFQGNAWIIMYDTNGVVSATSRSSILIPAMGGEQVANLNNKWWHVVAVFTTPATSIATDLYINGVLDNFQVANQGTSGHGVPSAGQTTGLNFRGGGNAYGGYMDEVAIYPTALSAGRVLAHYNAAVADDVFAGNGHRTPKHHARSRVLTPGG